MSALPSHDTSAQERFAQEYAQTFDDFVRHVRGQGFPVSERVLETAHDRATRRATESATSRGLRSVNFTPIAKAGLAKARAKYGY